MLAEAGARDQLRVLPGCCPCTASLTGQLCGAPAEVDTWRQMRHSDTGHGALQGWDSSRGFGLPEPTCERNARLLGNSSCLFLSWLLMG